MRRVLSVCLAILGLSCAAAAGDRPVLGVAEAWVRATVAGADATAAFLVLRNDGDLGDRLVRVSSPAAASVGIFRAAVQDGLGLIHPVPHVDLPPRRTVTFEPGGLHVVRQGLPRQLQPGGRVTLVLQFVTAEPTETIPDVVPLGTMRRHRAAAENN